MDLVELFECRTVVFVFDEYEHLEQAIREVRWTSGIDRDGDLADVDDVGDTAGEHIERLVAAPSDVWNHHAVQIAIQEELEPANDI